MPWLAFTWGETDQHWTCISNDCDCDDLFVRDIQIEEEMVLAEEKIQEEGGEQQWD